MTDIPAPLTSSRSRTLRLWTILLILSVLGGWGLAAVGLPAALLLGPMLAAMAVAYHAETPDLSAPAYGLAQGVLGCLIAHNLPATATAEMMTDGPLFVFGTLAVVAISALIGWQMTRRRLVPSTSAVWGLSPGAATVMTVMAEAYGADARLVAFMQYARMILVASLASLVARLAGVGPHAAVQADWLAPVAGLPLAQTLALAVSGPLLARLLKFRAGGMLIPMIGGIVFTHLGWMQIELPRPLLALSYAIIGWHIGLKFTRPLLLHALRALPAILAATTVLILACCGVAGVLVAFAGVPPLTAYLATSPGGADTVAIIAASSATHVDAAFVMSMQMTRFVLVLAIGPALARFAAARMNAPVTSE